MRRTTSALSNVNGGVPSPGYASHRSTASSINGIGNRDSMVAPPPTQMQPSNHVQLYRKCEPSNPVSNFWGRRKEQPTHSWSSSSSSAAITGTFVIDPELYLTPGLLNAMEDTFFPEKPRVNKSGTSMRPSNLKLEVENGAIDVDIHLVPSVSDSGIGTHQSHELVMPVQAQVGVNATIDSSGPAERQPPSSSFGTQKNPFRPSKSIPRSPTTPSRRSTTIELQIISNMQNDSIKVKPWPLTARIHAPNPRPPFHLIASTIPNPTTDSTLPVHPQLYSSPLYLHLPRTFRGPLAIHIASGNMGTHLRLSEELVRGVVLLRESEFKRTYFVGGLGWDDGEADERRRTRAERGHGGGEEDEDGFNRPGSDEESSPINERWYGDEVKILVGSGDVYLQFEDEDEPFSSQKEVGFWKTLTREFRDLKMSMPDRGLSEDLPGSDGFTVTAWPDPSLSHDNPGRF